MDPGNPIVMHFASGTSLFSGGTLLLLVMAASSRLKRRWRRTVRDSATLLGAALMLLSATPAPAILIWAVPAIALAWIVCEHIRRTWAEKTAMFCRGMLAVLIVLAIAAEIPHRLMPTLPAGTHDRIVVLGDSLSQGILPGVSWPKSLTARHAVDTLNLARNGATAADALTQAAGIPADADLVVIEIGGNDMLGGTPVQQFSKDLDALLTKVRRKGRVVIMLELPLPPLYEEWGRVQRGLAGKHGVLLLPKSRFAAVLATAGAVEDGLHLSAKGADIMGDMIFDALKPILRIRTGAPRPFEAIGMAGRLE